MSTTYTTAIKLQQPAFADRNWHLNLNANAAALDALAPVGDMAVTTHEVPSASLNVDVASGYYRNVDGTIATYAGAASVALAAGVTTYLYLNGSGALTSSTSGFPSGVAYWPLASVLAGASTLTSVADRRLAFSACGFAGLSLSGGSMADGANVAVGTATGTKLATAATQKLGFYGATPVVQPSGAAQAALTDSTGGTVGTTVVNVGSTYSQATLNANFASVLSLLNALRAAMVAEGLAKGSA